MVMTSQEARELLLLHSFAYHDLEHPKMIGGFLGSLRPYQGLNEKNFHEVMEALYVLAPQLQMERVDREIVSALWSICYAAWLWGLDPGGMLQRNGLIAPEDVRRLGKWLECLGMAVMFLLEGSDVEEALNVYAAAYPEQAARLKNPIQGRLSFDGDPS
jgi:hypothetical protein